ncbi:hypothetical protein QO010_004084 [Caulobacter ginsengisoli]|uniref:CENP-V/GFA domain-containing protein n=1 Tax=Caulobacter ginsengisoli TaxID=400775 RepID=A0ABU0IY89_9CAUL|nr:GFA family protein [Caulobacter ginsengisoli]MDQ0466291.1 hypothetical protein [Caulobacter ginsengisoli]
MIEGGCLCGAVRYTAPDPVMQAVCHCKNCQKQAGTAYSVVIGVPRDGLKITGEPKVYEDTGDSGAKVLRKFCPNCGSPIVSEPSPDSPLVFLKAGTLDDTSAVAPGVHIYTRSAMACTVIPEGTPKFETMPG